MQQITYGFPNFIEVPVFKSPNIQLNDEEMQNMRSYSKSNSAKWIHKIWSVVMLSFYKHITSIHHHKLYLGTSFVTISENK